MGFTYGINDEHKMRIALSKKANITISEDMSIFGVTKETSFINTIFFNCKDTAKSSISSYLEQRRIELNSTLASKGVDLKSADAIIAALLSHEEEQLTEKVKQYCSTKGSNKLYHINNRNIEYLQDDCNENEYYGDRPSQYIRSVVEEYCQLPFIEREHIFHKEIYDIVESACSEKRVLKIRTSSHVYRVYPYKIMPDTLNTRAYLVCYSQDTDKPDSPKKISSFSMTKLNKKPTKLIQTFRLTKDEIRKIEEKITEYSPSFLIGIPEQIKVQLTPAGVKSYQTKLFSRPAKIEELPDNIYVFDCSPWQALNYFFSFGKDAQIISPEELKTEFIDAYKEALESYHLP